MQKMIYQCHSCEDICEGNHFVFEGENYCSIKCIGREMFRTSTDTHLFKDFIEMYDLDDECAEWLGENYADAQAVYEIPSDYCDGDY